MFVLNSFIPNGKIKKQLKMKYGYIDPKIEFYQTYK
jgi:hypothetical protein